MAVISCPSCRKKISDKAKSCSYCDLSLSDMDADKIISLSRIQRINHTQRLMTFSFIAMLLFCGGFLFMFWGNVDEDSLQYTIAMSSAVIGFFLYIIIRVMLLFSKQKMN